MKDLYSAHVSEKDLIDYYEKVKDAYSKIFQRLGFKFKIVEASGGVFTDKTTHEFQVLDANGEDTFFSCDNCDFAQNKEIYTGKGGDNCPKCKKGKIKEESGACEVGNIFPLGTWYAERMKMFFADEKGLKKPVWFGSYGIGPTRVMGTWVEVSHDEKGIIWNKAITPFDVHLVELPGGKGEALYKKLTDKGIDVLWDDRDIPAGEKFADADLIGIPVRLIISEKTGEKIEWKERTSSDSKLLSFDQVVELL
jgi:prolyl-tRNA synthetase